jgi:twitching motility protein PilT
VVETPLPIVAEAPALVEEPIIEEPVVEEPVIVNAQLAPLPVAHEPLPPPAPQAILDSFVDEPEPVIGYAQNSEPAPVASPPEPAPQIAAKVEEPQPEKFYPPPVLIPPPRDPEPEPQPVAAPVLETPSEPTIELIDEPKEDQVAASIEEPEEELPIDDEPMPAAVPTLAAALPPPVAVREPEPAVVRAPEPVVAHVPDAVISLPPAPAPQPAQMPIAASIERAPQPAAPPAVAEPFAPVVPVAPVIPPEPVAPAAATQATVVPMTRTVRIEVPPRSPVGEKTRSTDIERLLRIAAARGASSLFLTSESRPYMRVDGDLRQIETEGPLSRADVQRAILEIAPESGQESIGKGEATEWISEFDEIGRIRCTTFVDHRGPGVLLRMIATRAATAEQLGLAREVQALATESQGLVLVAGSRKSGKSTLISALVDLVNKQRAEFIITLERQIRLVHDNKAALVSQREIRGGADESVAAARAALRENPDVLVVDDLVSSQMVPLLLTAASDGLLVFVSITAASTADEIERFVELAPPEMRKPVQGAMSESFRGAVAQSLMKKVGGGLVAARELMLATAPVTRVINEGPLSQLPLVFDSGRKHGMVSFTDALAEFVRAGTVDVREAFRKAPDRDRLLERLKRDGVDTSVVERLA